MFHHPHPHPHPHTHRGHRLFGMRGFGPRHGGLGRGWAGGDAERMERGHGHGGGRRRMFDGGELRLVLLKLIEDTPRHGYDLIRAVEERTGGAYGPSPGIVYPTLSLLVEMGLIEEQAEGGARKVFAITPEGLTHLQEHATTVAALLARLDAIGEMRERTEAVPIQRALGNLRTVLHNRLGEGLAKDLQHQAAALIDEAASKIERL